jgi:L-ascorbate metabolism protein UlaG (beta-lactamase superfamily)
MRLTKHAHSCVRLEHAGTTVVVDPGMFSTPGDLEGADAILITHEHPDHFDLDLLRGTAVPIHTIRAVATSIRAEAPDVAERVSVVGHDDEWAIGDIGVRAVGELHAVIHEDLPRFHNSGYLLDLGGTTVLHPGDALTVPKHRRVDVLLAPVCAPWMKTSEGIDFAREVRADRNVAIHDRVFSDVGLGIADGHFRRLLEASGQDYVRLADGQDLPSA